MKLAAPCPHVDAAIGSPDDPRGPDLDIDAPDLEDFHVPAALV
jgi:hypothetical protein